MQNELWPAVAVSVCLLVFLVFLAWGRAANDRQEDAERERQRRDFKPLGGRPMVSKYYGPVRRLELAQFRGLLGAIQKNDLIDILESERPLDGLVLTEFLYGRREGHELGIRKIGPRDETWESFERSRHEDGSLPFRIVAYVEFGQ